MDIQLSRSSFHFYNIDDDYNNNSKVLIHHLFAVDQDDDDVSGVDVMWEAWDD